MRQRAVPCNACPISGGYTAAPDKICSPAAYGCKSPVPPPVHLEINHLLYKSAAACPFSRRKTISPPLRAAEVYRRKSHRISAPTVRLPPDSAYLCNTFRQPYSAYLCQAFPQPDSAYLCQAFSQPDLINLFLLLRQRGFCRRDIHDRKESVPPVRPGLPVSCR